MKRPVWHWADGLSLEAVDAACIVNVTHKPKIQATINVPEEVIKIKAESASRPSTGNTAMCERVSYPMQAASTASILRKGEKETLSQWAL